MGRTARAERSVKITRVERVVAVASHMPRSHRSKAKLDAGRVDTVFHVGDRVLLRTRELLDAADIGKLR